MMNGSSSNGQLSVPPGFRFHPTDEELLYYYLRKKVSYEAIDLDVIREVDLNKLEPWDLKDRCRIGSGPQNEWYFFSHKDKKYPTGTRTNRATTAGFWKATGRDKTIHHHNNTNPRKLGLRKTLVFYTGRAPHGQKTDWIMHEYRLDDHQNNIRHNNFDHQEEGWVVCRVFKKKNLPRSDYEQEEQLKDQTSRNDDEEDNLNQRSSTWPQSYTTHINGSSSAYNIQVQQHQMINHYSSVPFSTMNSSTMHLPQLFNPDQANATTFMTPIVPSNNNNNHTTSTTNVEAVECSHNLLRLMSSSSSPATASGLLSLNNNNTGNAASSDWYFLDKLLASNQSSQQIQLQEPHHHHHGHYNSTPLQSDQLVDYVGRASGHKSHFDYFGCESDILKYSK